MVWVSLMRPQSLSATAVDMAAQSSLAKSSSPSTHSPVHRPESINVTSQATGAARPPHTNTDTDTDTSLNAQDKHSLRSHPSIHPIIICKRARCRAAVVAVALQQQLVVEEEAHTLLAKDTCQRYSCRKYPKKFSQKSFKSQNKRTHSIQYYHF